MGHLLRGIESFLSALARTPGQEFGDGMSIYRQIEHPRERRPPRRPAHDEDPLARAS